ncbi:hypothetical protein DPMN_089853 [Dreissena polymorpha]|uniref:Uncharacterized protein n=1 Tax=Dreissena polymorpha TaxID=45954 RepID=A0A9D4QYH1_DREPO|nr:hypothetical protein DPMN_089853 [Dreissena polymorpha]
MLKFSDGRTDRQTDGQHILPPNTPERRSPFNRDTSDNSAISATVWCSPLSDAFRLDPRYGGIVQGLKNKGTLYCNFSNTFQPVLKANGAQLKNQQSMVTLAFDKGQVINTYI